MAGMAPEPGAGGGGKAGLGYRRLIGPLLVPTWVMIGIFLVLPVLLMAVYSFLTKEFRGGVVWDFTLAAYDQFFLNRGLFGDEPPVIEWTYITIFWRSIWQAAVATLICLAVGFPTAWFIATRPPKSRAIWLFLITVPYWVNLLVRTVSMLFIIRNEGPLSLTLQGLGVISGPLGLAYTNAAIQIGLVYSYLPFMVLPVYAAIERFDFRLLEAANDLYSDRWTALRLVILPSVASCTAVYPAMPPRAKRDIARSRSLPPAFHASQNFGLMTFMPGVAAAVCKNSCVIARENGKNGFSAVL
jgi:spermidine/putrescine transport system permease protein